MTLFYLLTILHQKEANIREQLFTHFNQTQWYITHLGETLRDLKYISENQLNDEAQNRALSHAQQSNNLAVTPQLMPLHEMPKCGDADIYWRNNLAGLGRYLYFWQSQFVSSYGISRVLLINNSTQCIDSFLFGETRQLTSEELARVRQHLLLFSDEDEAQRNAHYWAEANAQPNSGNYSISVPIYRGNQQNGIMVVEQNLKLNETTIAASLPVQIVLVDRSNKVIIGSTTLDKVGELHRLPVNKQWFGYVKDYRYLVMRAPLSPGPYSLLYSIPSSVIYGQMKLMLLNALLLNLFSALFLLTVTLLFERRMLQPALNHAQELQEHELVNRKIVASAPVGICILRLHDGGNLLSNELAHNYLSLLTAEDKKKLGEIIRGQQINFVDVLTESKTNLQISFVHSRYRKENVAICVLVDVSARVKMEQSLQEIAEAAEQASQAKSMFLATVSHELRTPLYGIIGNLDLLQSRDLPEGVRSLFAGMHNSSGLLLKIINDILDFSKIESEQLKITVARFSPYEVLSHIVSNFLPLALRKQLTLWCYIEPNVPLTLEGDPLRLQQVVSNLLSNAIKFTHTGGIIIHLWYQAPYLHWQVRDTGVGIEQRDVLHLFDPFFQVGSSVQRNFQGTGLGLAICEKLIHMMDGDISVQSAPDMGSEFTVRLPVWQGEFSVYQSFEQTSPSLCLIFANQHFANYVKRLATALQLNVVTEIEQLTSEMLLITDYYLEPSSVERLAHWICFDSLHDDKPQLSEQGVWIINPATAYRLPELIFTLIQGSDEQKGGLTKRNSSESRQQAHQDILILVVDDHPINRRLLSEQLATLGYQTKTAIDGVEALKALQYHAVDIVLSDVNMPNLDGYGFSQAVRKQGRTLPIIGITANALAEEKQRCLDAGMNECLSKPITLDELDRALKPFILQVRKARA